MRLKAKRDANEPLIVDALESHGIKVKRVSHESLPDLLCGYKKVFFWVECKMLGEQLTKAQERFWSDWDGYPIYIAYSVDHALAIAKGYRRKSCQSK